MRLWTYQGVDHSLTDGQVDLTQLPYSQSVPGYLDRIKELGERIDEPNCQFIWCLTRDVEWKETAQKRIKFTLEVEPCNFLAVIDSAVWERILGTTSVPDSVRERWESEWDWNVHRIGFGDYRELKTREYHAAMPPSGSWWDSLINDDVTPESTVLLKHPIPHAWIIGMN
jgi:hypothetical protein